VLYKLHRTSDLDLDEELMLLSHLANKHPDTHFDRLPSCPLCLDKLDTTVTGLQHIPGTTQQELQWPGLVSECKVCCKE
jgi:hypothetical protein